MKFRLKKWKIIFETSARTVRRDTYWISGYRDRTRRWASGLANSEIPISEETIVSFLKEFKLIYPDYRRYKIYAHSIYNVGLL